MILWLGLALVSVASGDTGYGDKAVVPAAAATAAQRHQLLPLNEKHAYRESQFQIQGVATIDRAARNATVVVREKRQAFYQQQQPVNHQTTHRRNLRKRQDGYGDPYQGGISKPLTQHGNTEIILVKAGFNQYAQPTQQNFWQQPQQQQQYRQQPLPQAPVYQQPRPHYTTQVQQPVQRPFYQSPPPPPPVNPVQYQTPIPAPLTAPAPLLAPVYKKPVRKIRPAPKKVQPAPPPPPQPAYQDAGTDGGSDYSDIPAPAPAPAPVPAPAPPPPPPKEATRYYYPPRLPLPLPKCFHNPTGYVCCNEDLNDLMVEAFTELEARPKFHTCNIQALAHELQDRAQRRFNASFETVAGFEDFAQKIHFNGDLVCKVELGGRYMLAYGTVEGVTEGRLPPLNDIPQQGPVEQHHISKRNTARMYPKLLPERTHKHDRPKREREAML